MIPGWEIETAVNAGGTTVTIASHDPVSGASRRHKAHELSIGMFADDGPASSIGRFHPQLGTAFHPFGRLVVVPGDVELEVRIAAESRRRMIWCRFDRDRIALPHLPGLDTPFIPDIFFDLGSRSVAGYVRMLAEEARMPKLASDARIAALSVLTLIEVARVAEAEAGKLQRGGLAPWQLRRIRAEIEARYGAVPISALAALCGLSERHFRRAFRQSTGLTAGAYLRERRLAAAEQLLCETRLSMAAIADRLGLSGPSTFTALIRDAHGMTPSDFRRQRRR
ncbi:helix-turn-helix domain-containing protein [Flavisphingomonas formosensis]|uniref:helix-turn-helix domain-containing protein n=1 Tax=Flavisphingomonas formosensis TaxID=861534 RepID=UPI0012F8CA1E|nr:AraC family transcriptional regulator [Sphingomonas formosensis]